MTMELPRKVNKEILQNTPEISFTLRKLMLVSELYIAKCLLILGILIVPYANIQWRNGGWMGALILLSGGLLLAFLLTRFNWEFFKPHFASISARFGLGYTLLIGVFCQIAVATLTQPSFVFSDPHTYLGLAERLAQGMEYIDESGYRAFWPPGLPFFLSPFVFFFGTGVVAVTAANLFLYIIGAYGAWDLGRRLFDHRVASMTALLFTIWPSRLLTAAVATKENLTVAMILVGSSLCVAAVREVGRRAWLYAIGAGIAFGIAALAQPGLLLFVLATPLIYRGTSRISAKALFARSFVVIASTVICLTPWHIRNCIVFNSQFCGMTTNGGSVFYRANNPKATGSWIAEGEVPISHLPELEQNRIGFDLGKRWIFDHPSEFIKLAAKKLMYLLGDDSAGAYMAIFRGGGLDHDNALKFNSNQRNWSYKLLAWLSTTFWVIVLAWAIKGLRGNSVNGQKFDREPLLPLVYPLLYSAAVFSVFESGARQHMAAEGPLLVLAASFLNAQWRSPVLPGRQ